MKGARLKVTAKVAVDTYLWLGRLTLDQRALACSLILSWCRSCEGQWNHGKKDIKELHRARG